MREKLDCLIHKIYHDMGLVSRKASQARRITFRMSQGSGLGTKARMALWAEKGKSKPIGPRVDDDFGN